MLVTLTDLGPGYSVQLVACCGRHRISCHPVLGYLHSSGALCALLLLHVFFSSRSLDRISLPSLGSRTGTNQSPSSINAQTKGTMAPTRRHLPTRQRSQRLQLGTKPRPSNGWGCDDACVACRAFFFGEGRGRDGEGGWGELVGFRCRVVVGRWAVEFHPCQVGFRQCPVEFPQCRMTNGYQSHRRLGIGVRAVRFGGWLRDGFVSVFSLSFSSSFDSMPPPE